LPTKDHFSSNWTSWVAGGKSHDLVVGLPGVSAGARGIADDGILIDADQACRLAHPAALVEVLEDRQGLGGRQAGSEQSGALAFAEAALAGAAGQQAAALGAVIEAAAEVVAAA
jgi:hypothetical protein